MVKWERCLLKTITQSVCFSRGLNSGHHRSISLVRLTLALLFGSETAAWLCNPVLLGKAISHSKCILRHHAHSPELPEPGLLLHACSVALLRTSVNDLSVRCPDVRTWMESHGEKLTKQMSAEVNLVEPPLDMHCYLQVPRGGGWCALRGKTFIRKHSDKLIQLEHQSLLLSVVVNVD